MTLKKRPLTREEVHRLGRIDELIVGLEKRRKRLELICEHRFQIVPPDTLVGIDPQKSFLVSCLVCRCEVIMERHEHCDQCFVPMIHVSYKEDFINRMERQKFSCPQCQKDFIREVPL